MFNARPATVGRSVITGQSVLRSVINGRPQRRSDDGQTILKPIRDGPPLAPDLGPWVRYSRLGLTWGFVCCRWFAHRLSGRCPRCFARFVVMVPGAGRVVLDDLQGEVLEFGEQGADFLRVVEQGLPVGELGRGEPAGDGLAADLAGPFGVGAVQPGRVGVAAAVCACRTRRRGWSGCRAGRSRLRRAARRSCRGRPAGRG